MHHGRVYVDELREKRKKRKVRTAFLVFVSLAALAVFLVYALFFSGWFLIQGIEVKGNVDLQEEEVKNLVNGYLEKEFLIGYIRPFSNILFIGSKSIERSLEEKFPIIEKVNVNKNFFNRNLSVEVWEREAAGIWCRDSGDKCFYFDKNLILFKPSPRFSGEVFLTLEDGRGRDLNLADRFEDKELFEKINSVRALLDELKFLDYTNFFLPEGSFEYWVKTKEGWYVYLDKESDIATQLVALKKFLEEKLSLNRRQNLQYIDLRVNNRIYYK